MALFKYLLIILLVFISGCKEQHFKSEKTSNRNIYQEAQAGMYSPAVQSALPRVYVPNSLNQSVSIIDPQTYAVIKTVRVGKVPQHIVPSYDLKTLWILNNKSNSAMPINPNTAEVGAAVAIEDPYNLYFTPDGRFALGVDEAKRRIDYRDPQTLALIDSVPVECLGVNHMDFTFDGKFILATCEFSGQILKLDVNNRKVVGYLKLGLDQPVRGCMPQDIRLSPDGRIFYVADMNRGGVFLIDPDSFTEIKFIPTGVGTHGIYPSRDGKLLYVTNRGCQSLGCKLPSYCPPYGPGSISVIDPKTQTVIANWPIPGGGSPDMGNVSGDGKELWLSGRYDSVVYVFNTQTGQLTHKIPVGKSPHGLTVWPQPGRYSLGHTGNMR